MRLLQNLSKKDGAGGDGLNIVSNATVKIVPFFLTIYGSQSPVKFFVTNV